jgi:hypothetical protein
VAYTQIKYSDGFGGVTHFEWSRVQLVERFKGLRRVSVCFLVPCTENRFAVVITHCRARD